MNVSVRPGKYVVAVSGGVDSVVLLHMLAQRPDLELVVAHLDHGIRPDSPDDVALVQKLAATYGLVFETKRIELGAEADELTARRERYAFLQYIQTKHGADAIVTAHHQDDALETAIHNMIRGTGRRGLTSLQSTRELLRPLLDVPKAGLVDYALKHKLSWREDTTNHDERYARNYIRHRLLVRFDADARQQLLTILARAREVNNELDALLAERLAVHAGDKGLDRRWFCSLPHEVSKEVMMAWLRAQGVRDFDARSIERLTVQAKVLRPGKMIDVLHGSRLTIGADYVIYEKHTKHE
jgi:tRNA(Ile)-lysidine synthetase-like protein